MKRIFIGKGIQVGDRVRIISNPSVPNRIVGVEGIVDNIIKDTYDKNEDQIWSNKWSDNNSDGYVDRKDLIKIK